jgi:hypothetical protein
MVFQETRDLILNYITERKGKATKNDVIRYMENDVPEKFRISKETTRKELDLMERSEKLTVMRGDGDRKGQSHKLLINDKDSYNQIYQKLCEIENFMSKMESAINEYRDEKITKDDTWLDQDTTIVTSYDVSFTLILRVLLLVISDAVYDEKDSQILYDKVVRLMLRLNKQCRFYHIEGDIEAAQTDLLNIIRHLEKFVLIPEYIKDKPSNSSLSKEMISNIEDFIRNFLQIEAELYKKTINPND